MLNLKRQNITYLKHPDTLLNINNMCEIFQCKNKYIFHTIKALLKLYKNLQQNDRRPV